jgi:hypothetical protein
LLLLASHQPSRFKLSELILSIQGTKSEDNSILDCTIFIAKSEFSGLHLKPTVRILERFFLSFCFNHFHFVILLPERRAEEAWEPSNKVMLFSPLSRSGVTIASYYTSSLPNIGTHVPSYTVRNFCDINLSLHRLVNLITHRLQNRVCFDVTFSCCCCWCQLLLPNVSGTI